MISAYKEQIFSPWKWEDKELIWWKYTKLSMACKTYHQTYRSKPIWKEQGGSIRLLKSCLSPHKKIIYLPTNDFFLWDSLPPVTVNYKSVNEVKNWIGSLFEKQRSHCVIQRRLSASLVTASDIFIHYHFYYLLLSLSFTSFILVIMWTSENLLSLDT